MFCFFDIKRKSGRIYAENQMTKLRHTCHFNRSNQRCVIIYHFQRCVRWILCDFQSRFVMQTCLFVTPPFLFHVMTKKLPVTIFQQNAAQLFVLAKWSIYVIHSLSWEYRLRNRNFSIYSYKFTSRVIEYINWNTKLAESNSLFMSFAKIQIHLLSNYQVPMKRIQQ